MTKLLGNAKPSPEALQQMRERGGSWAAYQSMDMSSSTLGSLRFLQYGGPESTFKTPPEKYPDTPQLGIGWRYLLVGKVDLETGEIVEL
jgi:hypothetical protein